MSLLIDHLSNLLILCLFVLEGGDFLLVDFFELFEFPLLVLGLVYVGDGFVMDILRLVLEGVVLFLESVDHLAGFVEFVVEVLQNGLLVSYLLLEGV